MANPITYTQWLNQNELRAYPLKETTGLRTTDEQTMPNNILVDMCIMVPSAHSRAYLSSLYVSPYTVTLAISSGTTGLLIGTYSLADMEPYTAYPLVPVIDDVSGWVAFGANKPTVGTHYKFSSYTYGALSSRVVRVIESLPVKRILRYSGDDDQYCDGDVAITGGGGVLAERDTTDVDQETIIFRLDKSVKSIFTGECDVFDCVVPPIRSINGVCPDDNGRITLRFE